MPGMASGDLVQKLKEEQDEISQTVALCLAWQIKFQVKQQACQEGPDPHS